MRSKKLQKLCKKIQYLRKDFRNPTFSHPWQMRNGLWIGFLLFSAIAALLFWISLYMYFELHYRRTVTDNLKHTAWELTSQYGEENFSQAISILTRSNNYFAQIISEDQNKILASYTNEGIPGDPQSSKIAGPELFSRLDKTDGYCFYYVEDPSETFQWAVEAIVLANTDGCRQVLVLSCSTTEIDTVKHMLLNRGGFSLTIVLALSALFAFFLSNFYARPFRHLNDAAMEMANGNFDTNFIPEGPIEAVQLSETLTKAEHEFQATEQLRRDFIANISHDMKTPLTVIRAYAEMIDAFSWELPDKRREHIQKIIGETDRLTDLINELMDLSSLQSGTTQLHYESFSLNKLIETVFSRIRIKDMAADFTLRLHADQEYIIHADRQLLQRALYNLIHNAVKYSGTSRQVDIVLSPQPGSDPQKELLIQIKDYGIGMTAEECSHIWERFYRSPKLGNTIRGNGIGLNIVSEIFKAHHMPYGVESQTGRGSTFWFII